MAEQWKPVAGYEGLYEVSDHGRVRTVAHVTLDAQGRSHPIPARVRKTWLGGAAGHVQLGLCREGVRRIHKVHRLVAVAFIGDPTDATSMVCHRDGDPLNNHVSNLYWGTYATNMADMLRHGTHHQAQQTRCKRRHKLEPPNLISWSFERGKRQCWSCATARRRVMQGADIQTVADAIYAELGLEHAEEGEK